VMPYVEGETLRARLARERQLPVADAVRVASEVASALDYAHRHGVIHRDIKPENVLLGDDGQALVADFGIALAVSHAGGERITQTGLSLGTPQYMAPEQAAAERAVDARSDVYALGAVTYEMLAGEPPFTGASAQIVIARLMTEEPKALRSLRPSVPTQMEEAVHTALEKLPSDRFTSAGAFAAALADRTAVAERLSSRTNRRRLRGRPVSPTVAALVGLGLLAAGVAVGRLVIAPRVGTSAREPVRFVVEADSSRLGSGAWYYSAPAISPDGRTIVFAASGPTGARLYARGISDLTAHPLAGTDDGDWPFFSPDGAWVGFSSHGSIRKLRLDGGTPVVVAALPPGTGAFFGGAWVPGDTIVYTVFFSGALYRVSAAGGIPTRIALADTTRHLMNPSPLPGGRALLVTSSTDWRVGRIGVLDLATGQVNRFGAGTGARYVRGNLIYAGAGGGLYRQRFDLDRLAPSGPATEIASGLDVSFAGYSPFDVSPAGALVYRIGRGTWNVSLTDRAGRVQQELPGLFPWAPRFSPDGRRVAYAAVTPGEDGADMWSGDVWHTDILITDLATGAMQRLTTDGKDNSEPLWAPDGRSIAFDAGLLGTKDLFVRALDGDSARLLTHRPGEQSGSDWASDGSAVLFDDDAGGVWLQPMNGGVARPYLTGAGNPSGARVSPDGRWAAYVSNETGRAEVYVQSYPTPGRKALVSSAGGTYPAWRRDGRELYYWQGREQLIAANLDVGRTGGPPVVRGRTPLFRVPHLNAAGYDVSPDGSRFVFVSGGPRVGRLVIALDALTGGSGPEKSQR
ncbi:MAG: protein kinase, partial [Gemmatimonadaceae bacterium]